MGSCDQIEIKIRLGSVSTTNNTLTQLCTFHKSNVKLKGPKFNAYPGSYEMNNVNQ